MNAHTPCVLLAIALVMSAEPASAQEPRRVYAGALFGVSTLSADGRSIAEAPEARVSLYKPENGPALNLFAGLHLTRFFSLQANYVWNRNDVALFSSLLSPTTGAFYEQARVTSQHAVVGDALLYFRARGSGVRPYLSTGLGVTRFGSTPGATVESGLGAPAGGMTKTELGLRVAVGIDLAFGPWGVRYSFSETISGNPISDQLTPRAERSLANFQNLFGFTYAFPR